MFLFLEKAAETFGKGCMFFSVSAYIFGKKKEAAENVKKVIQVLKVLVASYIVTGLVLVFLTILLYHFEVKEGIITAGVIVAYLLSGFFGGFLIGKKQKEKKYLWGALVGAAYFIVLAAVSLAVYRKIQGDISNFFTTMALCVGSGMLGGMIS